MNKGWWNWDLLISSDLAGIKLGRTGPRIPPFDIDKMGMVSAFVLRLWEQLGLWRLARMSDVKSSDVS